MRFSVEEKRFQCGNLPRPPDRTRVRFPSATKGRCYFDSLRLLFPFCSKERFEHGRKFQLSRQCSPPSPATFKLLSIRPEDETVREKSDIREENGDEDFIHYEFETD